MSHRNAFLACSGHLQLARCIVVTGGRCAGARNGFVSVPTAVAWSPRYREAGEAGLEARTSRPASCPHRTGVRTQRRVLGCR